MTVLDQMENWSQIRTPDGYIGYVKNSRLKNVEETVRETYYQGPEYTTITMEDRVNLKTKTAVPCVGRLFCCHFFACSVS